MKTILFTSPNHDYPTDCLHFFSKQLAKEIELVGEFSIVHLEGKEAVKSIFEKRINKGKPRLIVLNGHGTKDAILGHQDQIILDEQNISLLKNTLTYAVACDSSQNLGDLAITKGKADAYIGYDANFMVVIDPSRSSIPSKDKNVLVFYKPYAAMVLSLVSGRSVEESISQTKETMRKLIREYGIHGIKDSYGDAPLIRFALYWNHTFLKGYGDLASMI